MTEIPEHLLKRSRDRRAALGLGGGEQATGEGADEAAPAEATPATTGAAAPAAPAGPSGPAGRQPVAAPAEAPPPKPDPPYVAAAKSRAKIPFWAMAALSLMPIWAFMYVRAITEEPEVAAGPLGVGAESYGGCTSCHGASGEGGSGRQLNDNEVWLTFPHIEDHIRWVYFGTEDYQAAGIAIYGNPEREGEAHQTGSLAVMPPQGVLAGGDLTDAEVLGVVCHERYDFTGSPSPTDEAVAPEYELWCSEESPIFVALEAGTTFADLPDAGLTDAEGNAIEFDNPIGDAPAEGSAP